MSVDPRPTALGCSDPRDVFMTMLAAMFSLGYTPAEVRAVADAAARCAREVLLELGDEQ